jgi:hypothetical protein
MLLGLVTGEWRQGPGRAGGGPIAQSRRAIPSLALSLHHISGPGLAEAEGTLGGRPLYRERTLKSGGSMEILRGAGTQVGKLGVCCAEVVSGSSKEREDLASKLWH